MKKDILIAALSAILGAAASLAVQKYTEPFSEISIRYLDIASADVDYVREHTPKNPRYSLHSFSIKNTGTKNLKSISIEFSPGGGDSAYIQDQPLTEFVEQRTNSQDYGRLGVTTKIEKNTILRNYQKFPAGAVDNFIVSTDDIISDFQPHISDPDVNLILVPIEYQFQITFPWESEVGHVSWIKLVVGALLGAFIGAVALVIWRKRFV